MGGPDHLTLGHWHFIAFLIGGQGSPAVRFIERKAMQSPLGMREPVLADGDQMMHLLVHMTEETLAENTTQPREIPLTNEIQSFFHCAKCMPQKPSSEAPMDWAKLSVGFTKLGIQVWCNRCEANVLHVDFEGQKHPATTRRLS